jgi:hypothetical protein
MSGTNTTTREIGLFVADWITRNDAENLKGKVDDCADRLSQALRAAFPGATGADIEASAREVITAMEGVDPQWPLRAEPIAPG